METFMAFHILTNYNRL